MTDEQISKTVRRLPTPLPARESDAHKGDFGRVLLIGGSRGMAGSIALSSIAALKTGAGLVSVAIPDRCLETVAGFHPSIMTIPLADDPDGQFAEDVEVPNSASFDVVACGPGMRTAAGSVKIVENLLRCSDVPRVFDADALNVIAEQDFFNSPALPRDQSQLVLTPHPGELARLVGVSAKDREQQIRATEQLCQSHGLTVVVKGGPTVVVSTTASGDASRYINASGNPGMATAGSGDVLTGMIGSLLGQGLPGWDAARLGVFLHGLAGDLAAESLSQTAMTSYDLLERIPAAILAVG
jgi:NAD(P)H-hydrate epimerase